jgi:hypothetical protein
MSCNIIKAYPLPKRHTNFQRCLTMKSCGIIKVYPSPTVTASYHSSSWQILRFLILIKWII